MKWTNRIKKERNESKMNFDVNNVLVYIAAIVLLFVLGKLFIIPIKTLFKLVLNSILGGVLILLINGIGSFFHFHIGLNILTSLFVGILGIPGAIVLVLLKLVLG